MKNIEENIVIETTKIADKFFKKYKNVYDKFIEMANYLEALELTKIHIFQLI